jgi:hypothetical protein
MTIGEYSFSSEPRQLEIDESKTSRNFSANYKEYRIDAPSNAIRI